MRQVNLDHNGCFYLYAKGNGSGHGFFVRVTTIEACINIALNFETYRLKHPVEKIEIQIVKGQ